MTDLCSHEEALLDQLLKIAKDQALSEVSIREMLGDTLGLLQEGIKALAHAEQLLAAAHNHINTYCQCPEHRKGAMGPQG